MCPVSEWILEGRPRLRDDDRVSIEGLRRVCEAAELLDLKIELDKSGGPSESLHQLLRVEGELVGYAGMTRDGQPEACGMVHPGWRRQGIGRSLLGGLRGVARGFGRKRLLIVCEDSGPIALDWMRRLGAVHEASERRMTLRLDAHWDAGRRAPPRGAALELRRPTTSDRQARRRLLMERFDETAEEIEDRLASYDDGESLIALDGGRVVGTLRLIPGTSRWMIYGFVIDRERRGQGLGSRMLAAVVDRLRSEGVAAVGLEVDPENTPAIRLYERFGFETVTTYRYMRLMTA